MDDRAVRNDANPAAADTDPRRGRRRAPATRRGNTSMVNTASVRAFAALLLLLVISPIRPAAAQASYCPAGVERLPPFYSENWETPGSDWVTYNTVFLTDVSYSLWTLEGGGPSVSGHMMRTIDPGVNS